MKTFDFIEDALLAVLDQLLLCFCSLCLHFALFTMVEHYLSIRNGVASLALTIFQSQPIAFLVLPVSM